MPIKQEPPITEDWAALGNSTYGCAKSLGEKYVEKHTPHIILRYSHLYGAEKRYHGLIGGFISRIEFGMEPVLYGGKQSNDFCYIKDIAEANKLALTAPWDKWNQAYNIGTGEELSAEDAGQIVCEVFGYSGKIQKKEGRTVDPSRFVYDMSKIKSFLGFEAKYDFKKGLEDMKKELDIKKEGLR
jgi:nucleoside-diphosphate-sugar epimerase